jgi:hypothetical protein
MVRMEYSQNGRHRSPTFFDTVLLLAGISRVRPFLFPRLGLLGEELNFSAHSKHTPLNFGEYPPQSSDLRSKVEGKAKARAG